MAADNAHGESGKEHNSIHARTKEIRIFVNGNIKCGDNINHYRRIFLLSLYVRIVVIEPVKVYSI